LHVCYFPGPYPYTLSAVRERKTYFKVPTFEMWEHSSHHRLIGMGVSVVSCCFSLEYNFHVWPPPGKITRESPERRDLPPAQRRQEANPSLGRSVISAGGFTVKCCQSQGKTTPPGAVRGGKTPAPPKSKPTVQKAAAEVKSLAKKRRR